VPLRDIPRISKSEAESSFQKYVFERQPVVITDLFDRQEISSINTIDDATRAWGTMTIQVQEEYTSAEGSNQPASPASMRFKEYVEFTRSNSSTRLCCTEYETPARVLASFRLPPICLSSPPSDDEIFGLPKKYGDLDLATNTFIANRGNVAHLHFDGDQREVLLHQVYGSKRVVLFQPAAAVHLQTLDGPFTRPSLAGLYLENMNLEEKLSKVELADGYHTILKPGETIYIPMLMWHHLEYLDDAMSFSVRFGRSRIGRFLSLDNFHRDPYIQNVASKMVGPEQALSAFEPIIEEIKQVYKEATSDMRQKVRAMRKLFRRLCTELCPDAFAERLCQHERDEEQVSRILASNDMKGGLKYVDPTLIAGSRPVGAILPRQGDIIRDGIKKGGYSEDVARAVLFNRVGKADIDELTKAEAAQLIAYLRTPGAAW
jgi:hypothetical protein